METPISKKDKPLKIIKILTEITTLKNTILIKYFLELPCWKIKKLLVYNAANTLKI